MKKFFDPSEKILGGYAPMDGTVEFFGRIQSILKEDMTVLDLGAGRGEWYYDDKSSYRKKIRDIKGTVKIFIGVDIDTVVLNNPTTHKNYLMKSKDQIPLENNSVDLIICDYVFEHVENPVQFSSEINRVLKNGGYLCGRTPHKYSYIAIGARLISNSYHRRVLSKIQPIRKEEDIFPTCYELNTLKSIKYYFQNYHSYTYFYTAEPSYYFGNKYIFKILSVIQNLFPRILTGNIFFFLKKN